VSLKCEGLTHPHPNHGAVLVSAAGQVVGTAFHRAQGTPSVEEQVLRDAGTAAQGGTLYLNLETGDCHGDTTGLEWIIRSGVGRVVMGSRHPLQHIRGTALSFLRSTGLNVQLLEAHPDAMQTGTDAHAALCACLDANEVCIVSTTCWAPVVFRFQLLSSVVSTTSSTLC
jgi:diaminohydroxyphosphoribosylaminopyrimidine deaminase / 5-amino-6-(5-phosphoribosylamino)uracil reductase